MYLFLHITTTVSNRRPSKPAKSSRLLKGANSSASVISNLYHTLLGLALIGEHLLFQQLCFWEDWMERREGRYIEERGKRCAEQCPLDWGQWREENYWSLCSAVATVAAAVPLTLPTALTLSAVTPAAVEVADAAVGVAVEVAALFLLRAEAFRRCASMLASTTHSMMAVNVPIEAKALVYRNWENSSALVISLHVG